MRDDLELNQSFLSPRQEFPMISMEVRYDLNINLLPAQEEFPETLNPNLILTQGGRRCTRHETWIWSRWT